MLTPSKAPPLLPKGRTPVVPHQQKTTQCGALAAQHNLPLGVRCNCPLDSEALARLETQVGAYWSLWKCGGGDISTVPAGSLALTWQLSLLPCKPVHCFGPLEKQGSSLPPGHCTRDIPEKLPQSHGTCARFPNLSPAALINISVFHSSEA